MAEPDLTEEVTIYDPVTDPDKTATRQVGRGAVPYFPGYVELDKAGRVKPNQTTPREN